MTRPELHIDFETRSLMDLKKVGVHVYAAHESTDLWCACWTWTDGDEQHEGVWVLGQDPAELKARMRAKPRLFAHNAGFEFELWRAVLGPRHGVPVPEFGDFDCTAAMAAAMALPRDLARAAKAMGLDVLKDDAGKRLMLQMCKPRRVEDNGKIVWWDQPEKIERLVAYCAQDVRVEHALAQRLRPLSPDERAVWLLDHEINDRGVQIDLKSVHAARVIAKAEIDRLNKVVERLTGGEVRKVASDHAALKRWVNAQGVETEAVDKAAVNALLESRDTPARVKQVLGIRRTAGRSSLAKLDAMMSRAGSDGRARGNLLYHGAGTGRWAASGIQLQNLLRPWMKYRDLVVALDAMTRFRDPDWLTLWGDPVDVIANAMRLFVTARDGHELVMADFSNIEGRVLAWLAGEEWKLNAFRAYDAGEGPDLYLVAAAAIFGVPVSTLTEDSPERQVGKVSELAQGYQGGHMAWLAMAGNYNLKVAYVAQVVQAATAPDRWEEKRQLYSETKMHCGLEEREWTALRCVIDGWRGKHSAIVSYWQRLEDAAMSAVGRKGRAFTVGPVGFAATDSVLWCQLPSKRLLSYPSPRIEDVETPWGGKKSTVTFMGEDRYSNQWVRQKGYGGLFAENITQAVARDIMASAMHRVEGRGWPVVLTVHDEIVSEVPAGSVPAELFGEVMRQTPPWADGLPVAAKGLVSPRYRK